MISRGYVLDSICEKFILLNFLIIPFEYIVYLFLPETVYYVLKFGPEIIIYLLCFLTISRTAFMNRKLEITFVDVLVLAFVAISTVVLLQDYYVQKTNWFVGIRVLLRYYAVFLILNNIKLRVLTIHRVKKYIFFFMVFGILFYILNMLVFKYRYGQTYYFIFNKNPAGIFMFIIFAFYLYYKKVLDGKSSMAVQLFMLLVLCINNSVQSIICYTIAIIFLNVKVINFKNIAIRFFKIVVPMSAFILLVSQLITFINDRGIEVFAYSYNISRLWSSGSYDAGYSANFRLYLMFEVLPMVWAVTSPLIGMGAGTFGSTVSQMRGDSYYYDLGLGNWIGSNGFTYVADNGVMTLLAQYGIIGTLIFEALIIAITVYSYKRARENTRPEVRLLSGIMLVLCISSFILNFVAPLFEIRVYAFSFWMFLGMLFNLRREGERT